MRKVMTIEEYCNKNNKQTLLQNFMLDINPDPSKNMCCADSAICSRYSDTTFLFNFKCHICNTEWEGSGYSYIVKELTCPTCNEDSTHQKIKYASVKLGSISLADWCTDNKERGKQLREEWTGIDEDDNEVDINKISYRSNKKVQWKCKHGHIWVATIASRADRNYERNCPYCAGQRVSDLNSLSTWCLSNTLQGEIIKNQWTGISEDGKHYIMDEVSYGSNLKMLWRDEFNHEWYATILNRTGYRKSGCPYCAGKKVSDLNSLSIWCLNNTVMGQIITSQWTGISENGKHYTMDEVSYASTKRMLWHDEFGHEWPAAIHSRTLTGSGCPYCNKRSTSYPEQFIYWSLKQLYPKTQNRYKAFKDIDSRGIELDIYIEELNLAIEYSPTYWHNGKKERDNLKKQLCKQDNIRLIQIIEDRYKEYTEKYTENYICIPALNSSSNRDDCLLKIVSYILSTINHSINEIDIELVKKNALEYSKKKIEYEKSLKFIHPELAKEMDNGMNDIKSDEILPNSHIRVKFICPNCQYGADGSWEATVNSRVNQKSGCKQCGYNCFIGEVNPNAVKVVTVGVNDLKSQCPELAKEWHKTLNNITSSEVRYSSNIKRYWQCPYCSYGEHGEWIATPNRRTTKGYETSCPRCRYSYIKAETNQPQNIKSQYRKSATPSKPKPFKIVELSDIDKEMQSWDF